MTSDTNLQPQHYDLVSDTRPIKCYMKRILGQVYVNILDPYNEANITGLILKGNPKAPKHDSCIVKMWSIKQDKFFRELNKRHFDAGRLIEIPVEDVMGTEKVYIKPYTEYSDDELLEVLKKRYAELAKIVSEIQEVAVIGTLLQLAEEHDKSKRTVALLQSRLSELQEVPYQSSEVVIEK